MHYPVESFTESERKRLEPYFTTLDSPVFALKNLPETVKGALFARYSRYPGTLKQMFLDEFIDGLEEGSIGAGQEAEGDRAAELYERIFLGYGDDSVAQLGGVHIACEWSSNLLTKILQRPRLGSYLEQSTRYIAYDKPVPSLGYRYYRSAELGSEYEQAMDRVFTIYEQLIPEVTAWLQKEFPLNSEVESELAYNRAIKAKALDLIRGVLPAASLSHMGVFATGQTYEQLIMHLLAHPLTEAKEYGQMILTELKKVIPSFLSRIERPERGGKWIEYLEQRASAESKWADRLGLADKPSDSGPSVKLLHVDGSEEDLLVSLLFEGANCSELQTRKKVESLSQAERAELLKDLIGERENRRHRPGRGFESVRYRFEITSDYGAFRDLQRHRLLTVQWQRLTPDLGAEIPQELVEAGLSGSFEEALDRSQAEYQRLVSAGHQAAAPYALCLAYRMRYVLDLNAREAMHLIELRSGREGHPSYRAVAHEMHSQISDVHPAVAAAMNHIDLSGEPRLERLLSEMRTEKKQQLQAR